MTTTTRNEDAEEQVFDLWAKLIKHAPSSLVEQYEKAVRRATVERIDWQGVRLTISSAYYETREAGGTMEAAADSAIAHVRDIIVLAILDEEAAR